MKAALFGATGTTGRLLLDEARGRGWHCRALVRDRRKLAETDGLLVVEGDARSHDAVSRTVEGADAVFCCLGMSDITKPATDFSDSVKTIVRAMQQQGVSRIVAIASVVALDHPTGGYRSKEGLPDFLKNVAAEHIRNLETLRDSGLQWTLMCPATLNGDISVGSSRYLFDDVPTGSQETGYADLALTMVELVHRRESFGKRVGIVSFQPPQ